ncbi:patatin-like phospholipase family protein [Gelidibacter maritimus]|uniref:Patatin-like phospholipase family protein n=1 Tax=Gelidibacter maritimus TaxID=2761487 RepID=A0A7W2M7D1_9FLAO|nr:patatin-like phospholipase family protein [Gelidibacter maritimus]MBA6154023.1 patatin-like phospholipase family protein [Gelidibacter maritimus]
MNIGLVLSGGGMRGAAHIGVLRALEEHQIDPTYIAGSSAGAIVGSLFAYGYNWEEILTFFKDVQILNIRKYAINKPGFIDAEKFYDEFKVYLEEDDFSFLKKELFVTATNILKGKLRVFEKGELIKPVLASAAFPGLFAPVKIKSSYYIDGGALNNFPLDAIKKKCDRLIGVYVDGFDVLGIKELKHSHHVVERVFRIKSVLENQHKFTECDLMILPSELNGFGTFDKKNIDAIVEIGYKAAKEAILNYDLEKFK